MAKLPPILAITCVLLLKWTPPSTPQAAAQPDVAPQLHRIAAAAPGTLGARVIHVETGSAAGVNDEDWFPMMSVYKLPIAIHALRRSESGTLDLRTTITLASEDRRPGSSPLARTIETSGPQIMTLRDLLSAVIRVSDNTASDRLLREIGGPAAVAATLRASGIQGIDVSRYELEFAADYYGLCCVEKFRPFSLERFAQAVERIPASTRRRAADAYVSDRRDSAQPRAFAELLIRLTRGDLLNKESTQWLLDEMGEMHSRDGRLRAGLPAGTPAALRPGTSGETAGVRAAHNDTGVVTMPDGSHLVIVAFLKSATGRDAARDAVLADVARVAYRWAAVDRVNRE
jgi:beta-lactamase class A